MNNSQVRVAIICDTSGRDDEGMKKVARSLASSMVDIAGFSVSMISTRSSLSRASEFDVYHFIGGPSIKTFLVAFYCRRINRRLKTILTFTNPILGRLTLALLPLVKPSLCIVSSRKWRHALEVRGVLTRMLNVSGVDVNKFSAVSPKEKKFLREQLKWSSDQTIVLHVGHLKKDRNIEQLLNAQHDPRIQLVIVGSTTTKQSKEQVDVLRNAGSIVVTDYVCNIEEYYQAADCYVFPTINERAAIQVPLSILEALAVSLPIITTDYGGLRDVFYDQSSSFHYIEESDFENLADIVLYHVKNQSNVNTQLESITWTAISDNLVSIYEE